MCLIGNHSHTDVLQPECVRSVIFTVWEKVCRFVLSVYSQVFKGPRYLSYMRMAILAWFYRKAQCNLLNKGYDEEKVEWQPQLLVWC